MSDTILAPFGLNCKPHAANPENPYAWRVRRKKKIYWEKSKSKLQTVFVRRLQEILEERGISDNQLATLIKPNDPASIQRSISRITGCQQDPSLEKVYQISVALDLPVTILCTDQIEESVRKRTPLVSGTNSVRNGKNSVNTAERNKAKKG